MPLPLKGKGNALRMGDGVGDMVTTLHHALALRDRVVISSLQGNAVIVKHMRLPPRTNDIRSAVEKEASRHIPFPLEDLYLDVHVFDAAREGSEDASVMVVAARKKVIHHLEAIMERAGLSLAVVDVDAFALHNCFAFNYPEQLEPAFLLDIGSTQSILALFTRNAPFAFRELGFGGQQMAQTLARHLKLPLHKAETLLCQGPEALALMCPGQSASEVGKIILKVCQSWCGEIRRVEPFFQTSTAFSSASSSLAASSASLTPRHLYLSGGGSLLPGLDSLLGRELGMRVTRLEPWRKIRVDTNRFDSQYVQAVGPQFVIPTGLALRGCL